MACCRIPRLRSKIVAALIAIGSAGTLSAETVANPPFEIGENQGVFLIVTDIHFDPFTTPSLVPELDRSPVTDWPHIFAQGSGQKFQGYGSDAGYPLTHSALRAAAKTGIAFDYVLYTGDYLSHGFGRNYRRHAGPGAKGLDSFSIKTARFVSNALESHFQHVPIFGALGNTDAVCGDYMIAPGSDFTAGLKRQWQGLSGQPGAFENFDAGGYYKVAHPTVPSHDIIVLNDIFWSIKYDDRCEPKGGNPGRTMMSWLERELMQAHASGRNAQIIMHVPPGINAYSTSDQGGKCPDRITPYWKEEYSNGFIALMQKYPDVVKFTFSGHTHMDSFVVLRDKENQPAIAAHISPSVSPVFGNNPAFTAYLYDRKDGTILDAATWYLTNLAATQAGKAANWALEYSFAAAYAVPDMTAGSLMKTAQKIKSDDAAKSLFTRYYAVSAGTTNPIDISNFRAFSCAQTAVTKQAYAACYCTGD